MGQKTRKPNAEERLVLYGCLMLGNRIPVEQYREVHETYSRGNVNLMSGGFLEYAGSMAFVRLTDKAKEFLNQNQ